MSRLVTCAWAACGQPFVKRKHNQVYCSHDCKRATEFDRASKRRAERAGKNPDKAERPCGWAGCAEVFVPERFTQRYCCPEHMERARMDQRRKLTRAAGGRQFVPNKPLDVKELDGVVTQVQQLQARYEDLRERYSRDAWFNEHHPEHFEIKPFDGVLEELSETLGLFGHKPTGWCMDFRKKK